MSDEVYTEKGEAATPTQIRNPLRTTIRTVVWVVLALIPTVPIVWSIVQDELTKAGIALPPGVTASIGGAVAFLVAMIAIVQRVVLIPAVNELLTKINLGPRE